MKIYLLRHRKFQITVNIIGLGGNHNPIKQWIKCNFLFSDKLAPPVSGVLVHLYLISDTEETNVQDFLMQLPTSFNFLVLGIYLNINSTL